MKRFYTIIVFYAILHCGANAQIKVLNSQQETRALSNKVTELFRNNEIAESFEELGTYWPLPENELDAIEEKTIKYLNILKGRFGDPIGTVKVKEEKIADVAIRETYLVRYQNTAIRLKFIYYKNDEGWIVNAFKWDDSFTEEFQ